MVLPGSNPILCGAQKLFMVCPGSIVAWFKRELCGGSVNYATLNQEAEAVPPGCDGVSCLDHFQVRDVECEIRVGGV
jgi:hypothetical protein